MRRKRRRFRCGGWGSGATENDRVRAVLVVTQRKTQAVAEARIIEECFTACSGGMFDATAPLFAQASTRFSTAPEPKGTLAIRRPTGIALANQVALDPKALDAALADFLKKRSDGFG